MQRLVLLGVALATLGAFSTVGCGADSAGVIGSAPDKAGSSSGSSGSSSGSGAASSSSSGASGGGSSSGGSSTGSGSGAMSSSGSSSGSGSGGATDAGSAHDASVALDGGAPSALDASRLADASVGAGDASNIPEASAPDAAGEAGPAAPSTATSPQLSDAQAANDTALRYLAQAGTLGSLITDNWDPTAGLGNPNAFVATFTVAADGTGTHTTVQAAVTAAASQGGASRVFIRIQPGTYRELVCVRAGTPPITLYGTASDPSQTVIVFGNFAGGSPSAANPCNPSTAATLGTFSTATLMAFAAGFEATNLTVSNDYAATSSGTGQQAVALMTQADRVVLDHVRLLGFQDTLFLHTSAPTTVARVYIKDSFVQGDTDFIFGRATVVLDGGTIDYVTSRRGGGGTVLAPSTDPHNPFGILVTGANWTLTGALTNSVYLGRAWDNGVASAAAYVAGTSPNGQALVRESTLGAHIRTIDPWAPAATSARPFSATGNRLAEYRNQGPGAAH